MNSSAPGRTLTQHWTARDRARQRRSRTAAEITYDIAAWTCGLLLAGWATRDVAGATIPAGNAVLLPMLVLVPPASGLLAGLYRSRRERGSVDEIVGIALAACASGCLLTLLGRLLLPDQRAPLRTVAGAMAVALLAMLTARYVLFAARRGSRAQASATAQKIIVFGAGDAGTQLVRSLLGQADSRYRPVALLDDDPDKRRLRVLGVPVLGGRSAMADVAGRTGARVLVIAIARPSGTAIRDLTAEAERCGLIPKVIPSVAELIGGCARIEGVRDPRITDLLGRRELDTDIDAMKEHFAGKRILVTGAGGSIGSELCRQLHSFGPAQLIMLDRDESALHALQLELHGRALLDSDETVLADIRDPRRVMQAFQQARPQIVFHAAALKHLPLLERYPAEALKSNVWGTHTVLAAAAACGVESFVNISTDKAANPVSVLGYSKRIAERLAAHMAGHATGRYLSVRFGNVLGSRGSVLTALTAQVAAGGPVTVTHPDVSRYFMTAYEAVQLVLQAAVIGRTGEVLVLDMGEQVRIADIARRLIATEPRGANIVFTGLRPGEKLSESLLGDDELDERPYHPLIRHTPVAPLAPRLVTALDPAVGPEELRATLARCADATRTRPPQLTQVVSGQHIATSSSTSKLRTAAVRS